MQGPRPGRECLRAAIVQQPGAVVCGAQRSNHAGLDMMKGGSMVVRSVRDFANHGTLQLTCRRTGPSFTGLSFAY